MLSDGNVRISVFISDANLQVIYVTSELFGVTQVKLQYSNFSDSDEKEKAEKLNRETAAH